MIPEEELSTLLQHLTDSDPAVQRTAAETLSEGDERSIYPLIRALRDANTGVQDAAMRSIIAIGGEVAAYMALPLFREGPFLRNTARIILRQIGRPAVPLLRTLLADKDDDVRTFAVDLISDIGWCDYPAEIARLLEADPNQNVQASAARAIGVLGYREGLPVLVAALKNNEWVCFSALESIALLKDESSIGPVLSLLGEPSETMRYAAIETLGKIGSSLSSEALLSRLPLASDFEKTAIVRSLVQIGITPSMALVGDLLIEMYTHGDWEDRLVALTGLADLKDKHSLSVILDVAGSLDPSDPESEVRLSAVKHAVAKFGCLPSLSTIISDPAVKFRSKVIAIEVIGDLHCPDAVPHLISIMDSDLREVRRASVLALAEIRDDSALHELSKLIDDRDGHVRNTAISALGRIGDKAFFAPLLRRLDVEKYNDVLEENVKALLSIDPTEMFSRITTLTPVIRKMVAQYAGHVDLLLALSEDQEQSVRLAAISSLGRHQDTRVAKRLSDALADHDPEVRKTSVMALGSLHCCTEDLKIALKDSDRWVRLYAVRAIGDSGIPEAANAVIPLLYDKEVSVVLATIDALIQLGSIESVALSPLRNHPEASVRERVAEVMERI
jgi:HEAT repeat protein